MTTEAKAKELRKHFEPLVTEAKRELTLARRRRLQRQLLHQEDLESLLEVAKVQANRPGGYLRLTHLPRTRSDAASEMRVEIIADGETPAAK